MNDLFASLYEYLVYHNVYSLQLLNDSFYFPFGIAAILPPIGLFAIFYFLVKYPWCRWWHWGLVLLGSIVTVGILSYNMLSKELAQFIWDPQLYPDAKTFMYNMLFINILYGFISSMLSTLLFKQFPLPQRNIPWGGKK
jgi:hypothetical protein